MKAGWEVKPLGEVAKTTAGGTPKKSNKAFYEGGTIPWLVSGEVANANITESKNFITEAGLAGSSAKIYPENSVLVAMYGATAGEVGILRFKACSNQAVCAVLPNPNYLPEYLYYCLLNLQSKLAGQAIGNAQPNISQAKIKALEIPIPPLEEQKRIVAVLDAAFEGLTRAKDNAEANLQNARELFEATLDKCLVQDAANWPEHSLENLGKLTTGGTPKSADKDQYGDAMPFIKPGHFQVDGSLNYDDVGLSTAGVNGARVIPEHSALMVCIGATIGKSGYSLREVATNQQINSLTPNEGLNYYFAYLHFITPTFQKQVIASSGQATLPIINKTKWGKLKIKVPKSLAEQEAIVDRMQEIRKQVDLASHDYRTKLTDIADLSQSLLQKAFAGALT